jgi:hypothetical protein
MTDDDTWFAQRGDELRDDEYPEGEEFNDETETAPCPQCGAEIYEDAVACPVCGTYVTRSASVWADRPGWWIVLGVLGAIALILVLTRLVPW